MGNPLSRYLIQQQSLGQVQGNTPQKQGVNQQMLNGLHNMVSMFNGAGDKGAVMQALASANPQMGEIFQLCSGKDVKEVFIQECMRRGVDPQYALGVMAQIGIK